MFLFFIFLSIWSSLAAAAAGDMYFLRYDEAQLISVNFNNNLVGRYAKKGDSYEPYLGYIIQKVESSGGSNIVTFYTDPGKTQTSKYYFNSNWTELNINGNTYKRVYW